MHRAPFRTIIAFQLVLVTGVNRAYLVVSTRAHTAVRSSQSIKEMTRDHFDIGSLYKFAEFPAPHAQIEDDVLRNAQVRFNHSAHRISVVFQPCDERVASRERWQAAGMAKCIVSQSRMNVYELFK